MSGVSLRSMTITRNPLGSVCSTGLGNVPERGGAGGGGVACGVCALTNPAERTQNSSAVFAERRKQEKEDAKANLSLRSFLPPLRLCGKNTFAIMLLTLLLRRFRQVVQNQSIRIREVFLHHALYVGGCHSLQPIEIGIDTRRISQQHRCLPQSESLAVACFALPQLPGDHLVLGLFQFSG